MSDHKSAKSGVANPKEELRDLLHEMLAQPPALVTREDIKNYLDRVEHLLAQAEKRGYKRGQIDEREAIALDNYSGHTLDEGTNWRDKFQRFVDSNEKQLAALKALLEDRKSRP